jgi:hypothetical protein
MEVNMQMQMNECEGHRGSRMVNAQQELKVHRPTAEEEMKNFRNQRGIRTSHIVLASEPNQALSPTAQPQTRVGSRATRRHAVWLTGLYTHLQTTSLP